MLSCNNLALSPCPHPMIKQLYLERRVHRDDRSPAPMDVYIPREQGDYLYSLVRALRPSVTLEVGMANGLSTLFIAQALRENGHGRHIAIDPFQLSDWGGAGLTLLQNAGLDSLVNLIQKPSHQAIPELEQAGITAQLVFIDGSHLFDYVMADFLGADRVLEPGGLMAFDDSDWPSIVQVIRFVLANRAYRVPFPGVVIEPPPIAPTLLGRMLRRAGKVVPKLGAKLRPGFMTPEHELGVKGRCVVLQKLGHDDRESQSRFHRAF